MIFQIFDFTLGLSFFEAGRTQVLTVERDIAQRTQKSTTGSTRDDGFFTGVIKAAGLFIHLQCLTGAAGRQRSGDGRENIDPQGAATCGACNQRLGVGRRLAQWGIAIGAVKHKTFLAELEVKGIFWH